MPSSILCFVGLISSTSTATASGAYVDQLELRVRLRGDGRYFFQADSLRKGRLQGNVRLDAGLQLAHGESPRVDLSLRTMAVTGGEFTSQWTTLYDADEDKAARDLQFFIRQLYLQADFSWARLQFGNIPPVKGAVSGTSVNKSGWFRGLRAAVQYDESGILEMVAATIGDRTDPQTFQLPERLDIYEMELTQRLLAEAVTFEAAYERFEGLNYIRGELRLDAGRLHQQHFEVAIEILYNLSRDNMSGSLFLEADLLPLLWGRGEGWLEMAVIVSYKHPDVGPRGSLSEEFIGLGETIEVGIEGDVPFDDIFGWFVDVQWVRNDDGQTTDPFIRIFGGLGMRLDMCKLTAICGPHLRAPPAQAGH